MRSISSNGALHFLLQCVFLAYAVNAQTTTPTQSPTVANSNSTMPPAFNGTSDIPTTAPTNSVVTTKAPTLIPTLPPINTTSPTISLSPTMVPTRNATAMPSNVKSASPTMVRSQSPTISSQPTLQIPVPTIAPTKKPTKKPTGVPSASPSGAATMPPVATENIDTRISNIQITFAGISTISSADVLESQSIMEKWFEDYFNVESTTNRRQLFAQQHRNVQQFNVPEVRNMKTVYDVENQDTLSTSGSNTVTYTQNLVYDATPDAKPANNLVLLPFADTPYKNTLLSDLKTNVPSFSGLSVISTPVIAEPQFDNGKSGLSLAAIIGIGAGGAVGLLLLACGAYVLGSRRDDRYPVGDGPNVGGTSNNINSGYLSADEHDNMLPSTFQMSIGEDDVISTMDDPTVAKISGTMSGGDASGLGGYGDQRYNIIFNV
jgi:hypothetical protein